MSINLINSAPFRRTHSVKCIYLMTHSLKLLVKCSVQYHIQLTQQFPIGIISELILSGVQTDVIDQLASISVNKDTQCVRGN